MMERFISKIVKSGSCWEWTAAISKDGYGRIQFKKKARRAHRISYMIFNGPLADDEWVLHSCDNRLCVNPDHLRIGTHAENVQDRINRTNDYKGANNPNSKLSDEQVAEIRKLGKTGMRQVDIGKLFGVEQAYVSSLLLNKMRKAKP